MKVDHLKVVLYGLILALINVGLAFFCYNIKVPFPLTSLLLILLDLSVACVLKKTRAFYKEEQ